MAALLSACRLPSTVATCLSAGGDEIEPGSTRYTRQHHSGPFEAHCVCKDCRHQVEPDPAEMADPVQTPPDDSQLDAVYSMMQKTAA
jgi:hypothetical protein